jgi:hypothetical protein
VAIDTGVVYRLGHQHRKRAGAGLEPQGVAKGGQADRCEPLAQGVRSTTPCFTALDRNDSESQSSPARRC